MHVGSPFLKPNRMQYVEGLVQERRNVIANALELRLSWTD